MSNRIKFNPVHLQQIVQQTVPNENDVFELDFRINICSHCETLLSLVSQSGVNVRTTPWSTGFLSVASQYTLFVDAQIGFVTICLLLHIQWL